MCKAGERLRPPFASMLNRGAISARGDHGAQSFVEIEACPVDAANNATAKKQSGFMDAAMVSETATARE